MVEGANNFFKSTFSRIFAKRCCIFTETDACDIDFTVISMPLDSNEEY